MASKTQSINIALILFVILSIGLGVGIYMQYQKFEEINGQLDSEIQNQKTKNAEFDKNQVVIEELKVLIGCPEDYRLTSIDDLNSRDKQKYTSSFPADDNTPDKVCYSNVIKVLFEQIQDQKITLAQRQEEIETLKRANYNREDTVNTALTGLISATQKDQKALGAEYSKFLSRRTEIQDSKQKKADELLAANAENEQKVAASLRSMEEQQKQIADLTLAKKELEEARNKIKSKSMDKPDGRIVSINMLTKVAIIDLGSADNLRTQTDFEVYPRLANQANGSASKATIKVMNILGSHQAECLVIKDETANPIQVGDKIFTQNWTPGEYVRYAIAGVVDLNNDGVSDTQKLINYITSYGNRVDAWCDGTTISGKPLPETRFVILGEKPQDENSKEYAAYESFIKMTKRYNIPSKTVSEVMNDMGVKDRSYTAPTVSAGSGKVGSTPGANNTFRTRSGRNRVQPR